MKERRLENEIETLRKTVAGMYGCDGAEAIEALAAELAQARHPA